MPRFTISRVIGLVSLAWFFLVGTWFFLPSPVVRHIDRDGSVQHVLQVGSSVTTVLDYGDSFKRGHGGLSCGSCNALIFEWRLEAHVASDSLLLRVGKAPVNLTEAALRGPDAAGESTITYVSPSVTARVRAGGTDHPTILPWFTREDSVLIYSTMHGNRENINLRILSPSHGVVEVWKDIDVLQSYSGAEPLRETDREVGLLASFSHIHTAQVSGATIRANTATVGVSNLKGRLPSKTWPIRSIICGPLYIPTFWLAVLVWTFTFQVVPLTTILTIGMFSILLVWFRVERGGLSVTRWFRRKGGRRDSKRGIWGASGPVPDEESGLVKIRPQSTASMFTHAISKPTRSRAPVFDKT
jgi:hypothetical protein